MAVHKRVHKSGTVCWRYAFDLERLPGEDREQAYQSGFTTKRAAEDAEAERRKQEHERFEKRRRAAGIPGTLGDLLRQFLVDHADKNLAPKTAERYRELAAYLAPGLAEKKLADVTPLDLHKEWERLLASGGHTRKDKKARPMASKTVRNIAGVVSSAWAWGRTFGLATGNPAADSQPPTVERKQIMVLTPDQSRLVLEAAQSEWNMAGFLEVCESLGARRGEVLALRWSDISDTEAHICRSLSQTKAGLRFKTTKSGRDRYVVLPEDAKIALRRQESQQRAFREHFGSGYRADLDLVFAQPNGEPLKPDSVSAAVSALFRRLKLPEGASLHSLRHTHISTLLAEGMELPAVSKRAGHANPNITAEIYSHALDGRDQEAARKWDESQKRAAKIREHAVSTQ